MKNKLYRLTVLGVEQTLKMKFFIILNILMLVAVVGFVNFGTVKQIISKSTGNNFEEDVLKVMVLDETGKFTETAKASDIKNIEFVDYTEEGLTENKTLIEIKYDEMNIINVKITSNEYIDGKYYDNIQTILNKIRTNIFAEKHGVTFNEVEQLNKNVEIERVILKVDVTDYVKYEGIIMGIAFVMYVLFIFIAATISSTIGIEKISKTTEYMLTGISETAYLWYNILQVNIVFIIQTLLSGVYYVLANIISSILSAKFLDVSIGNIGISGGLSFDPILTKIVILTLVQTVLCVLILSIIQAIMTSKVNNMTDISNSSMLVILIVILVCFVSPNIINGSTTISIFIKIISCLPIFSIVMVPKLILLHQISNIGIIIAVGVNALTLVFLSIFGARWFKRGLLDAGNSKKTDKRKKDEIYDMNKTRFKEVIFKISISMLIFFIVSNVLGLIGIVVNQTFGLSKTVQSVINIIVWILGILPSYLYLKTNIERKKETRIKLPVKEATGWILMGLFCVTAVQYIVTNFINQDSNFDIKELITYDFTSVIGIVLFVLHLSILPAIFEELLFRGAILKMLSKYGNGVAIVISSICFGLIHQNITQGIFAFLMGLILSFITIKTKSILPAILIHFLNNFTAVISTIALETNNNILMALLSILIFTIAIISGVILFNNLIKNKEMFKLEKTGVQIKNIISCIFTQYIAVITLILYVIITIYADIVLF